MEQYKSCPFCGLDPRIESRDSAVNSPVSIEYRIACPYCKASVGWWQSLDAARMRWNSRNGDEEFDTLQARVKELEAVAEAAAVIDRMYFSRLVPTDDLNLLREALRAAGYGG